MSDTPPNNARHTRSLSADPHRAPSQARLIARLMRIAWQYRGQTITIIALQGFTLIMALSGLGFTGLGIDVLGYQIDATDKAPRYPFGLTPPEGWPTMAVVGVIAGAVLVIALLRFAFDRANRVCGQKLVQSIVVHLRGQVYDKLQRLSFRFFDANESSSIINRVTGDVQAIRRFIDGVLVQVMMLVLSLIFFVVYMCVIHPWLTLACLATTPGMWLATSAFSRRVKPAYRKSRELMDSAIRVISENAQAVRVIKGFSRQPQEIDKFTEANNAVHDQRKWIFGQLAIFIPLIGFLPHINLGVLAVFGGYLYIYDPSLSIGDLFIFSGLLQQFSTQVGNIANIANSMQTSLTGAQRVFEVVDAPVEIVSPEHPVPLDRAEGDVRFEQVRFTYHDEQANAAPALDGIDFHVPPGQTIAILGATGAGKSTLLSLIPRFYDPDPDSGRVLIDGEDARHYDVDALRRNVGMVFQESFLFSNTVAENIAFGHPEATREQIEKAARIAAAHDFIMEDLPDGYDTVLDERGTNLSGGQRQRIAIARAILLEPPILLLDDPTAAIDPETEHEILLAMSNAMRGRTTFVVAHRLSTLRRADQVIVLENGRIVQRGTHEELMNRRGHYRSAAKIQIADDESKRLLGIGWDQE